ncbi:MAG: 2-amino-4-hydroxy-6-hydroxymethyldihydropteridine diphosphokinase [Candidatus Eisenbacteria bacterium]
MKAYVGLGSNLGEREATIRTAIDELSRLPDTQLVQISSLYDTAPVGELDQPNFLNAVAVLETGLDARSLFWNMLLIERRLGRVRQPGRRFGPRTIDLDLLLFGDEAIDAPDLKVPHPEMVRRAFVLVPLVEVDPHAVHPELGLTMRDLLSRLDSPPSVRRMSRLW